MLILGTIGLGKDILMRSFFNLMLLSNKVGIDGCKILMKDHISYETDEYIQTVTDYKYYLEQSLDTKAAL